MGRGPSSRVICQGSSIRSDRGRLCCIILILCFLWCSCWFCNGGNVGIHGLSDWESETVEQSVVSRTLLRCVVMCVYIYKEVMCMLMQLERHPKLQKTDADLE